jgi:hypothetical protein
MDGRMGIAKKGKKKKTGSTYRPRKGAKIQMPLLQHRLRKAMSSYFCETFLKNISTLKNTFKISS